MTRFKLQSVVYVAELFWDACVRELSSGGKGRPGCKNYNDQAYQSSERLACLSIMGSQLRALLNLLEYRGTYTVSRGLKGALNWAPIICCFRTIFIFWQSVTCRLSITALFVYILWGKRSRGVYIYIYTGVYIYINSFLNLVNQIWVVSIQYSDWFWKRTVFRLVSRINQKNVITLRVWFKLPRFRNHSLSACIKIKWNIIFERCI